MTGSKLHYKKKTINSGLGRGKYGCRKNSTPLLSPICCIFSLWEDAAEKEMECAGIFNVFHTILPMSLSADKLSQTLAHF